MSFLDNTCPECGDEHDDLEDLIFHREEEHGTKFSEQLRQMMKRNEEME